MKPDAKSAIVREVGLRDGLQSISHVLPTAQEMESIRDAYATGQREIEVGSFVPVRLLPQLADTDRLVEFAKTLPGLDRTRLRSTTCAARQVAEWLAGETLHGSLWRAGLPKAMLPHERRSNTAAT